MIGIGSMLEPPDLTLDDLFRKTILSKIYYLPLSGEEVSTKLARAGHVIGRSGWSKAQ
jgi:hypothetical protein